MRVLDRLAEIGDRFSGRMSLYAESLDTGETVVFGAYDEPQETASVMKLPVLVEALRQCSEGLHRLDEPVEYQDDDFVKGSGILQHLTRGLRLSLRDVLTLMIIVSDNLATNIALRTVGIDAVNAMCQEFGLHDTVVKRKIAFDQPGPLGLSSPFELVQLLKGIYQHNILDVEWAAIAMDILGRQNYHTLLTREMPYELLDDNDDEPPVVRIHSKSGAVTGVRNDAGLVLTPWGDYAIAIMSQGSTDHRFHIDTEAHVVLPHAARAVFDYLIPESSRH